ncbi:IS21 family transposase [Propionivibrio dicarboxylicus]|uniref:Transposase n=1 Tax=Propionivibrio dicarboxylicus TaxID=83767 RepID=A0A1G7ZAG9_9RHOO|nr:IS21 family transposase [Propionivibrio dicarboxylicus]SDH05090.1 Transposase [Propionivibrio dicarboxylicus]
MAAERIAMHKIKELLRLKYECALSFERIGRALKLSKGVVAKYVKAAQVAGLDWAQIRALDEEALEHRLALRTGRGKSRGHVAPDFAAIHQELKKNGVTLALLWEEYRQTRGEAAYQYSRFCDLYRDYAKGLKRSMRQTHRAGEKLFADYAGDTVPVIDAATGEIRRAHIFVAVLGASNYTYACATAAETQADWLDGLGRALQFIGGVPELIVPDNPRALIGQANRYEPEPQRAMAEFAAHYGTAVLPARPYRPQDKAKVEVGVQIVQRWILARLRHRRFFLLAELNEAIADLVDDLNRRPFRKLPGCRRDAYESLDRPALRPLPATPFQYAHWKKARANIDYHVEVDGHYYSVPHALVRQEIEVRLTPNSVECFFKGKRVAAHQRSPHRGAHSTVPEHMPVSHRAHAEWTPGRMLNWAATLGPATTQIVRFQLESRPHPEQGYRACLGIMRLARQYGPERLEAACARAIALGACRYKSVASILKAGLDRQPLPGAQQRELILPTHANVRGASYYH